MIPQLDAAREIQAFCGERHWPFCIIGALAALRWGAPRATQDVDCSLFTGFGNEEDFISEILRSFESRISAPTDFALKNRVLLLRSSGSVDIDVSLAGLPFERTMIERASKFEVAPGIELLTCSAEDLIVLKAFASRTKDWLDIEGVLARQHNRLDWEYILGGLKPLCELKEAPEIVAKLQELRKTF